VVHIGGKRKKYKVLVGLSEGKKPLGDLRNVCGGDTFNMGYEEIGWECVCELHVYSLGLKPATGCCELSNKRLESLRCGEVF